MGRDLSGRSGLPVGLSRALDVMGSKLSRPGPCLTPRPFMPPGRRRRAPGPGTVLRVLAVPSVGRLAAAAPALSVPQALSWGDSRGSPRRLVSAWELAPGKALRPPGPGRAVPGLNDRKPRHGEVHPPSSWGAGAGTSRGQCWAAGQQPSWRAGKGWGWREGRGLLMGGCRLGFWVVEERVGTPGPQHGTVDTEPVLLGCRIGMGYARFVFCVCLCR